jgi:YwiC-like protein
MTLVTANQPNVNYHQGMAAHVGTLQNSRLKTMVIPREHGAWGMMLVPLATGAVVALPTGINGGALTLFILAAMSLFWLRTPVEAWLGTSAIKAQTKQERAFVLRMIAGVAFLAAACVALLLWNGRNRGLLLIGAIAALAFAAQAVVKKIGRRGRMPAQVIGAIGLTSTAAGAYYVTGGKLDKIALALWLANWLFAGDQIHFVQVRVRSSRAVTMDEKLRLGLPFFAGQVVLIGIVLAACRFSIFPTTIALAFVPVLFRGTLWFVRGRQPLDVHKLGYGELRQALIFGALLCAAFLV